jgi:hypothetical protein
VSPSFTKRKQNKEKGDIKTNQNTNKGETDSKYKKNLNILNL